MNWLNGFKTKVGGVLLGVSQMGPIFDLVQQGLFGAKAQAVCVGIGSLLTAFGIRDAIAKNGQGK